MKPEIGFTSLLISENILDDVKFAIEHKFDWIEICLDWEQNFDLSNDVVRKIREISSKHKLKIIVHTPYYLPTATILPELKEAVIENVTKGILFAKKVNSDRLTVHPGFNEMPGPAKDLNTLALIENLKEITTIAKKQEVAICLENFNNGEGLLCIEADDFQEVINSINNLKATLDIGHANTSKNPPHLYFEKTKKYIMNMHIHDNYGEIDEHNCLGEGNVNFRKLFDVCKKAKYKGPFILELFPHKNILEGRERFLKIWHEKM